MSTDKGRDATAIGESECTIFVLGLNEIKKIKDNFDDIYKEMMEIAIKRHKNHKILISKEVKDYISKIKIDLSISSDSE